MSFLRRRRPFRGDDIDLEAGVDEEVELFSVGGEEVASEAVAETAFLGIEEAAAGLDATGVGAPFGVIVGALAGIGFGAYEIYNHFKSQGHKIKYQNVKNRVQKKLNKLEENGKRVPSKPSAEHLEKAVQEINRYGARHGMNSNIRYTDVGPDSSVNVELLDNKGLVVPGSKYIGPGNTLNRGAGTSQVDEDAREHDQSYNTAKNFEDIQAADKTFLDKTGDHIAETLTGGGTAKDFVHGVIGKIGIGVKSNAEKVLGKSVYPQMPSSKLSLKRTPTAQETQQESPTKRFQSGESSQSQHMEVDETQQTQDSGVAQTQVQTNQMNLPGTAAPQAGGGAGGDEFMYQTPSTSFGTKISVYRKKHKFMTFGLIADPKLIGDYLYLPTSLAEVPWHLPVLYLTRNEFALIPNGSFVKEVKVKVTYRKSTVQFNTNNSTTQEAVLNQLTDVWCAPALNKTGWGHEIRPTDFDSTNPMKVTNVSRPVYGPATAIPTYRGMVADFYGVNQDAAAGVQSFQPKYQLGVNCTLRNYFCMQIAGPKPANPPPPAPPSQARGTGGWPMLSEKVLQFDGDTIVNQVILEMSYTPKVGCLKTPLTHRPIGDPTQANSTNTTGLVIPTVSHKGNFFLPTTARQLASGTGTLLNLVGETANTPGNSTELTFDIYTPIEKSQFMRTGLWGDGNSHVQPSCHIGVQPVAALNSKAIIAEDDATKYTTTRGYFQVDCEMIVQEHLPTALPYGNTTIGDGVPDVPYGDQMIWSDVANRPAGSNTSSTHPVNGISATRGGLLTTTNNSLPLLS